MELFRWILPAVSCEQEKFEINMSLKRTMILMLYLQIISKMLEQVPGLIECIQ